MRNIPEPNAQQWRGSARLGPGWGVFRGEAGDNHPHRHHAMQIMLSRVPQAVWLAHSGWSQVHGLVMGSHVHHQLGATRGPVALIYVDPTSLPGRQLGATLTNGHRVLAKAEAESALKHLESQAETCGLQELLQPLLRGTLPAASAADPLIEDLLKRLPERPGETFNASALYLGAGLSSSRLQHRFRQHTGLPIRAFLLWWRLLLALRAVSAGASLSAAAQDAGFADAAHCTRTFRRHFGIAPSELRGIRFGNEPAR